MDGQKNLSNQNLITSFILLITFSAFNSHLVLSQRTLQDYEEQLSARCFNCTNYEVNNYLLVQKNEKDSICQGYFDEIIALINFKRTTADKLYHEELINLELNLKMSNENWIELKSKCASYYANTVNGGTSKPLHYGLMYLLLSNQHMDYLINFKELAFGD